MARYRMSFFVRLLPDWVQWCLEHGGVAGELALRSVAAARTAAELVIARAPEPLDWTPEFRGAE